MACEKKRKKGLMKRAKKGAKKNEKSFISREKVVIFFIVAVLVFLCFLIYNSFDVSGDSTKISVEIPAGL